MDDDDFFEEDEPIEAIRARRARPYDFVTEPPHGSRTVFVELAFTGVSPGQPEQLGPRYLATPR